jgi:hypothetical protein
VPPKPVAEHLWWAIWLVAATLLTASRGDAAVTPKTLDLDREPSLAQPLDPAKDTVQAYLEATGRQSERSLIVVGRLSLDQANIRALKGRPARDFMRAVAETLKGEWEEYDRFYLLRPRDMARHSAQPAALERRYPELKRKYSGSLYSDLMGAVIEVGARTRIVLHLVGPGAEDRASIRSTFPCWLVIRDRTVAEFMRAITVLTGDPWHHHHDLHLLSFTGKKLEEAELGVIQPTLAGIRFRRGLLPAQRQRLATAEGLAAWQLAPQQRSDLALLTGPMRSRSGAAVEQLVLRRARISDTQFAPQVDVYVSTPNGLQAIGSMRSMD